MSKRKDRRGQRYGDWEMVEFYDYDPCNAKVRWRVLCHGCGRSFIRYIAPILKGESKSCRCQIGKWRKFNKEAKAKEAKANAKV